MKMDTKKITSLFKTCSNDQEIYTKIIELGKKLNKFSPEFQTDENRVQGCQSTSYLYSTCENGLITFYGSSDALISGGLMQIMLIAYSGQSPEFVLKQPPNFLEELGILSSISLTRVNGLKSLYLLMKQKALKQFINLNR